MNSITKHLLSVAMFFGLVSFAFAQPGWNWGDSVDKAKEKNALFSDMERAGNYQAAEKPLEWLLKNTPDLNVSLYQKGTKVYEGLAESTTDAAKAKVYQQKALSMYDLRIKYFGDEAEVLNRKAFTAYKYYKDDKSKYQELFDLFNKTFELNGNNVFSNNLTAYMDVIRRYKSTGGNISDEQIFEKYEQISDIIEAQIAAGGDKDRLETVAGYVDKLLTATVNVDCNFIINQLGPKFRQTQDINLAKKIFGLMMQQKCTDDPLAMEVAIAVVKETPDYGIYKFIGMSAAADGNMDKAAEYFEKAIEQTDDNTKKADVYLSLAKTQAGKNKSQARANARKALAFDPSDRDAYILIGDLYMNSYNDCRGGSSKVDDRGVFLAAYEMYKKGGDSQKMATAKSQFPSIEEIFSEGKKEGETITVGCWINETVTLERRPAN